MRSTERYRLSLLLPLLEDDSGLLRDIPKKDVVDCDRSDILNDRKEDYVWMSDK